VCVPVGRRHVLVLPRPGVCARPAAETSLGRAMHNGGEGYPVPNVQLGEHVPEMSVHGVPAWSGWGASGRGVHGRRGAGVGGGDPIVMLVGHQLGGQRARIAGGDRPLWVSPTVLTAGVMLAGHRARAWWTEMLAGHRARAVHVDPPGSGKTCPSQPNRSHRTTGLNRVRAANVASPEAHS